MNKNEHPAFGLPPKRRSPRDKNTPLRKNTVKRLRDFLKENEQTTAQSAQK